MKRKQKVPNSTNLAEDALLRGLDELAEYEDFTTSVLPRLRKAVSENWPPEKIFAEFGSMVAAKMVTLALLEKDPGKALAAAKDALDRHMGRATEKIETTHKYQSMSDEALDQALSLLEADVEAVESKH